MKFLRVEGYDFEQRNRYGVTPLLDHLISLGGRKTLLAIHLLLEFGADVHTTDPMGFSAIYYGMASNLEGEAASEVLEQKLSVLIQAGADIHPPNNMDVWTPSQSARYHFNCWDEWCLALKRNGLDIRDVVEEEGHLELLEDSSEDESGACPSSKKGDSAEEGYEEDSMVDETSSEGSVSKGGVALGDVAE